AQADVITGTYSGVVRVNTIPNQFYDLGNFFGFGANADLSGLPISGTFTYNADNAIPQVCDPRGASACTNYFGVMNMITATIGTHTATATGVQFSELSLTSASGEGSSFSTIAVNSFINIGIGVRMFSEQLSFNPADPNSPNFSITNPDESVGQLSFSE